MNSNHLRRQGAPRLVAVPVDVPTLQVASPRVASPRAHKNSVRSLLASAVMAALLCCAALSSQAQETIGGGTVASPAVGPTPSYSIGGSNMVLVKNWHFGTNGTIKNYADMSANFFYHDQFGTINNGGNYGSNIVSPDSANALSGQPIEGVNSPAVRQFTADSLKTLLTPLNGATSVSPSAHNVGNGSFMAKWKLPNGGSLLGRDIVWETRVRYVTPPYFWFALWTSGNKWKWDGTNGQGAEHDLMESFGYDNGGGNTNYDGRYWHSNSVAAPSKDEWNFWDWGGTMAAHGVPTFDPTQYHTWTWHYKKDNSFAMYCDGNLVQRGTNYWWTYGNTATDEPVDMDFLFDAGWGHNQVGSVNHTMDPALFAGKFFEWSYSRVYLSNDTQAAYNGPHTIPCTINAVDYDTGGAGVAYNQIDNGGQSGFRSDNSSADYGSGLGWTRAGQWYKYTVVVPTGGSYKFSFSVASPTGGGTFHVEDETGRNLTGTLTAPNTGSWDGPGTVTSSATTLLSSGNHILKWVQDSGGYNLLSMTVSNSTAAGATFAKFIKSDSSTQGNWKGVYGADGYTIVNDNSANNPKVPSYGSMSSNTWSYSWSDPASEGRALQKAATGSTSRIAAQLGGTTFDVDCNLTDGNMHQVTLYALDWDQNGRNQDVEVRDAASGTVLDTQNMSGFSGGIYYVWNIKGHVTLHVINKSPSNAALSGVFFDPIPGVPVNGNGTGLKGQYYQDTTFSTLIKTQTDPTINFDWGTNSPMSSVGPDYWTTRWTGQVQPRYSGTYTFTSTTDDGVRLWVNNQLLIDKWVAQSATPWSGTIALTAGQKYDIKMEYLEYTSAASAKLEWQSPSQAREVVPQSQLYPAP